MNSEPMVEVRGVSKRFRETVALRDVSFAVPRGSIWGFVGRNGAGKTTTLRILCTLLKPDDGVCRVAGHDPVREPNPLRRMIGFLPDTFALPGHLSLDEYLDVFGGLYGQNRTEREHRREVSLQLVGAESLRERRLAGLSRGEQQRVGLARCLMHNPDLLLLDEPAAGLDPHARVEFKELLLLLKERGKTVFFSSHILSDIEEVCDGLVVIREGKAIYNGPLSGFYQQVRRAETWVVRFSDGFSDTFPVPAGCELVERGVDWAELRGLESAVVRTQWLAILLSRSIPVCELSPKRTTLEQEFARLVEGA